MEPNFYFTKESFTFFEKSKWSSRVFNKQRMEIKESLKLIGHELSSSTKNLRPELSMAVGTETPAIWNNNKVDRLELFFMRSPDEQKIISKAFSKEIPMSQRLHAPSPLYAHPSLGIIISESGIEAGYRLPFLAIADRELLVRVLDNNDNFKTTIESLPGHFLLTFPDGTKKQISSCTTEDFKIAINQLETFGEKNERTTVSIVSSLAADDYPKDSDLIGKLFFVYKTMLPFYELVTWNNNRDLLDVKGLLEIQEKALDEIHKKQDEEAKKRKLEAKQKIEEAHKVEAELVKKLSNKKAPSKEQGKKDSRRSSFEKREQNRKANDFSRKPKRKNDKFVRAGRNKKTSAKPVHSKKQVKYLQGDKVIIGTGLFAGKQGEILREKDNKYIVKVGGLEVTVSPYDISPIS